MKQLLKTTTILLTFFLSEPSIAQIRLITEVTFADSSQSISKTVENKLLNKLSNYIGVFLVDRSSKLISDKKEIVDGKARVLEGADYLLDIDFKKLDITTNVTQNVDKKLGNCARNTIINYDVLMDVSISAIESGLLVKTMVIPLKTSEVVNCDVELNTHIDPFVDHYGHYKLCDVINARILSFIESSVPIEFQVLGEAYRKGNKISGVAVACQNEGFTNGQSFELYSRTIKKIGGATFDKNILLCNAYYFEDLGKYSTLLLKKPSSELQAAIENKERIVAVLKMKN